MFIKNYSQHRFVACLCLALAIFLQACSLAPGVYIDIDTPAKRKSEGATALKMDGWFVESKTLANNGSQKPVAKTEADAKVSKPEGIGTEAESAQPGLEQAIFVSITPDVVQKLLLSETQAKDPQPNGQLPPDAPYEYRVGPHDVLSITVWGHPELQLAIAAPEPTVPGEPVGAKATGHLVDGEGNIFFPHIGLVRVAGKTVSEIRTEIINRLSKYVPNPQLDVRVSAYRSKKAYLFGEVENRGVLPLGESPVRVLDAISLMGGVTQFADQHRVSLSRRGERFEIDLVAMYENGDVRHNYLLKHGDVLHFPDRRLKHVFVLGEFNEPNIVNIPNRGLTLSQVVGRAGGLDLRSVDASRIFVFRMQDQVPTVYHLDATSAEAMLLAVSFPIQPSDVVYAAPKGIVRWDRFVQRLLPTVRSLWYLTGAARNIDRIDEDDI
jgi:polysaccharide export outer membrane protein